MVRRLLSRRKPFVTVWSMLWPNIKSIISRCLKPEQTGTWARMDPLPSVCAGRSHFGSFLESRPQLDWGWAGRFPLLTRAGCPRPPSELRAARTFLVCGFWACLTNHKTHAHPWFQHFTYLSHVFGVNFAIALRPAATPYTISKPNPA